MEDIIYGDIVHRQIRIKPIGPEKKGCRWCPDEVLDHRFKVRSLTGIREKVEFEKGGGIGEKI